jgi:hypothetical protein
MLKSAVFFFLGILFIDGLFGQSIEPKQNGLESKKYIKYIEVRMENGLMLSNGTDFGNQIVDGSYYNAVDLRLGFQNRDANLLYSNLYRRPIMGIGIYSSTFNNQNVGEPNAIYYFFKMPFSFPSNKRLSFAYGAAFGLSYNFSPFDELDNPTNIFIGSYRNYYVHFEFNALYRLNKRFTLDGSIGFKHFSNGAFSLPNAGINLVPITVGLRYQLGDPDDKVDRTRMKLPRNKGFNLFNVGLIMGSKNYDIGERNYFKGGLGINYLRQISHKYRMGAGIDIYFSEGAEDRDLSDDSYVAKSYAVAVNGAWEWLLNKNLFVPLAIGVYLHRNEANGDKTPYYLRAGLRYRFNNNIFFGGTIKAHGGAADIFEYTLGYTFGKNPNPHRLDR